MSALSLTNLVFRRQDETILDLPKVELAKGSQTLLQGGSGSGKSTLVNLLAGFLKPHGGRYEFDGQDVTNLSEREWDRWRGERIGIVFQHYPLLRGFSVLENLLIPMGIAGRADVSHAKELLERVGLAHRSGHRPSQLSAGQRQRAALARALANRPPLILADEPTAHLDPENGTKAIDLLLELAREGNSTLLVVSHDPTYRDRFEQRWRLEELQRR